ncbi:MAG: ABC transporter ATP-binding protein, partial [Lachnospira sp.]|nr:ABC transporter ATP-binding protein [Lachnospira sp.]
MKKDSQNQNSQKTSSQTVKKVIIRIKKYWVFLILSIIMATITVASSLYVPILVGNAIDYIIGPSNVNFRLIAQILAEIGVVIGITALSQWIMNICNNKITYHVTRDIRDEAIEKIEHLPLKYIDGHSYGEIVSRVIADVDQFADGLLMGFTQFFSGVMTILGTLGFMLSINVKITLVVVLITPVSFFVASFIAKRTYKMFKLQSETRGEQTALIDEMIGNQKVVKAFGYEEKASERFAQINADLQKYSQKAVFYSSLTNPSTRFVNNVIYAGVALVGAFMIPGGALTVGGLSVLLSYANQYMKPFNDISSVITEMQNALACANRIFDLLEEEEESPDVEGTINEVKGNVSISHVDFSYDKNHRLIEDFNLEVDPGMRIAIVGPTGCGKTTFINLLMRFYDVDQGNIKIDGKSIDGLSRHALRSSYGMVLQETWIKDGTVRENIAFGKPDATDEDIIRAAKEAHSWEF